MRELMRQPLIAVVLCLGALLKIASVSAATNDDPPDRVARISFLKGDVSLQPAGTSEWAAATLNRPLTSDDQLSLDHNARAELQVGSATLHLDAGAAFSLSELSDTVLQARVTDGALHLNVRRLQAGEVIEIDTPQSAITVSKPGEYRIEVLSDGTRTLVKTYAGACDVAGNGETVRLQASEQLTVDAAQETAARETFTPRDEFDNWAQERNERFTRSASSSYVAPDVIGYEDLDGYGEWASAADYGPIWYPHMAVGWSPYRDGYWAWVSPWGWTWVDNAPWGFAPFHYGRWAHVHDRWGWVPGPVHIHAVYAPALVAWVGGPSFSMSISFGSHVGWFPLAPHDVYVPGYHCSPQHIRSVNYANTVIVNNTIINRAYVNRSTHIDYRYRNDRDAMTVVSRDNFVSARPVSNHMVRNRDVGHWQTHNAAPAIAPDRASTMGPRWNANSSHTSNHATRDVDREVVTRRTPPPRRPSFEQEQHAIRNNDNRPIPRRDLLASTHAETMRDTGDHTGDHAGNQAGQHSGAWSRDDHPHNTFDRAQPEPQPRASLPQQDQRSRDGWLRAPASSRNESPRGESPRARESGESHSPSQNQFRNEPQNQHQYQSQNQSQNQPQNRPQYQSDYRRQFERQPDRSQLDRQINPQAEQQWQRPRENSARSRPVERTERAEAPRRFEAPPQREQHYESAQQPAPSPSQAPADRGGRANRHTLER